MVTMARADDPADLVARTCGRAIPGMETRIGDGGELLVRGEFRDARYLDDPAATAAAIDDDGWLHTGDVGELDAAGNLRITDRLKDMYICGGFNVYPAEVEQVLLRSDAIADAAVVGVPDERMGEVAGPSSSRGRARTSIPRPSGARARAPGELQGAALGGRGSTPCRATSRARCSRAS